MMKNRITDAIMFAAKAHDGQIRKLSNNPYIFHVTEVGQLLSYMTDDEDTIIAGLLHDTVEDTDVTMEEIEENFGPRVRQLVEGETEDKMRDKPKADTWKQRKLDSLKELKENSDINEKMVWLCDKYSNVRSMYIHYTKNGVDTFKAFNESNPASHKWYYNEIAKELKGDLGDTAIYKEYVALVDKLFKEF